MLLLEARIDAGRVHDLEAGLPWIRPQGLPPLTAPEQEIPWLPADYLAGLLLNKWHFDAHMPVAGDRTRWRELLTADRPEDAMEVALQRLRVAEVVSWPWRAIPGSDPQRLLEAVQVPILPVALGRALRRG